MLFAQADINILHPSVCFIGMSFDSVDMIAGGLCKVDSVDMIVVLFCVRLDMIQAPCLLPHLTFKE